MNPAQGRRRLSLGLAGALALLAGASVPTELFGEGRGGGSGLWEALRSHVPSGARRRSDHPNLTFFKPYAPPRVERREPIPEAANAHERYVCVRLCDGAQLALGFTGTGPSASDYAGMCKAAGAGKDVALMMAPLGKPEVSEARFSGPAGPPRSYASMASFLDGKRETTGSCEGAAPLSVPIEADTTLRAGDIVATASGFKVYVGDGDKGRFVDAENGARVPRHVRQMVQRLAGGQ